MEVDDIKGARKAAGPVWLSSQGLRYTFSYIDFIYDDFIVPRIHKLNGCMCMKSNFMNLDITNINSCVQLCMLMV